MEDDPIEEVRLDLEVEEPHSPQPESEALAETDPATEAFARLEGEMAMVRHTVQNMARERADIVIPDYTATLGQMADQLAQVSKTLGAIGDKPAIELAPEARPGPGLSEAFTLDEWPNLEPPFLNRCWTISQSKIRKFQMKRNQKTPITTTATL